MYDAWVLSNFSQVDRLYTRRYDLRLQLPIFIYVLGAAADFTILVEF